MHDAGQGLRLLLVALCAGVCRVGFERGAQQPHLY